MSILKLNPFYKQALWGGNKISRLYKQKDMAAETWELSAHPFGVCTIENGIYKGKTFKEYIDEVGKEILGYNCSNINNFPILIKFLDASKKLSLQIHPNDEYALKNEGEYGKKEVLRRG